MVLWKRWFTSLDFHNSIEFGLFLFISFIVLSIVLINGGIVWLPQMKWQQLGWYKTGLLKAAGFGFLGFILLSINVIVWGMVQGLPQQTQMSLPTLNKFLLVAFFGFSQPAWVEENLYRGYLQPLLTKHMKIWVAIVVQAAFFSLAHLGYLSDPIDFGQAFVAGLVLGGMRGRTSSLVAPYIAHGLFWLMAAF